MRSTGSFGSQHSRPDRDAPRFTVCWGALGSGLTRFRRDRQTLTPVAESVLSGPLCLGDEAARLRAHPPDLGPHNRIARTREHSCSPTQPLRRFRGSREEHQVVTSIRTAGREAPSHSRRTS